MAVQRTEYGVPEAACPMAVACGRAGLSQGGGAARAVKPLTVETTDRQEARAGTASTYHLTPPLGTLVVSALLVELPMTLYGPPSIDAHTLYSVAFLTFDHPKRTGDTTWAPPSGRCSNSGPFMSQVLSGMMNVRCADSTVGQAAKKATTHHS